MKVEMIVACTRCEWTGSCHKGDLVVIEVDQAGFCVAHRVVEL